MKQYEQNNSLRWALLSLNLEPYTHIVIYTRIDRMRFCLGGSNSLYVILKRYGDRTIVRTSIVDNCLSVEVSPLQEDIR